MKIWMVCETLTELAVPNITVIEIKRNLEKLGHNVILFCPSTEKRHASLAGANLFFVPTVSLKGLREIIYQFLLLPAMLLKCLRGRPDWVYVRPVITMVSPALMANIIRRPAITHFSGDLVEGLRSVRASLAVRLLYGALESLNVRLSSRVVVETETTRLNRQERHKPPPGKLIVIPNGANVDMFRPMDARVARKQLLLPQEQLYVGFAGNLTPFQGLLTLVQAAPLVLEAVPAARFLIVGDGESRQEVMEAVDSAGLSRYFVFTGRVSYEQVPLYIAASDVCVAPRIRDMCQKTGISLLKLGEYMACERAVVASDIDGVGPVLRHAGSGIPVSPEDPRELATAIIRLLSDRPLREDMGRRARQYVLENGTWESVARRLVEAYVETGASRKGRLSGNDLQASKV